MAEFNREAIARKIRALKQRTVENGCTEDEAIAAAKMLADILAKYNMSMDEAEIRESPFRSSSQSGSDAVSTRMWKVGRALSELTGARFWLEDGVTASRFFGFEHEVAVAEYLYSICRRACVDAYSQEQKNLALFTAVRRRRKLGAFLDGMVDRLALRIIKMIPPKPPGKGLIVLKNQLIDDELLKMGIKLEGANVRGTSDDLDEQYAHGVRRADDVALDPAITTNPDDQKRIR